MLLLGFVIAQIVIFAVIIIILKRLIFEDTTSAVNRLTKLDEMNREKEKILAEKLDHAEKYFEKKKRELEESEKKMKAEAQRAANQLHDDIVKQARAEAEEIIKKAQAARQKMRVEAQVEAEAKVVEFCVEILGNVFSTLVRQRVNEQLIEEFMNELEKADLTPVGKDIQKIELSSAHKISDKLQGAIKALLRKKLEREVQVEFKEDLTLYGGVSMKFGTMVVDGSLAELLRSKTDEMKEGLAWKHTA